MRFLILTLNFIILGTPTFAQIKIQTSSQQNKGPVLSRQKACDILDLKEVALLLNAKTEELIKEDMGFAEGSKRSICHYLVRGKSISYNLRLAWQSDKAIANKVLQKKYLGYLNAGEPNMKAYKVLFHENDIQIIYGEQKTRDGVNCVIRKRYGNSAECKIELLLQQSKPQVEKRLFEIVSGIK